LRYGQQIEVEGKLRSPRNFGNPNAFDYRKYLARQDVFWTMSALSAKPIEGPCGDAFHRGLSNIRSAALSRIERLYHGDRYNTAMMDAVLIGESSGLDRLWTEQYRSTGTFHALVISGSHVAVVAGVLLFLLRICFVSRVPATFILVLAAWAYAILTGWQAPVIRSAAGMSLFAIGGLVFRQRRLLNILAAVALLFLLIDPDQIFDASFQLSFLAVAFLAVFAVPLIERTSEPLAAAAVALSDAGRDVHMEPRVASHRVELRLYSASLSALARIPERWAFIAVSMATRVGVFFYELLVTSAVIQAGLALPMALYFHRVSISGLSANAIVVPLLGLVVPIGGLALVTGWHWLGLFAAFLLDLSRRAVEFHAQYEPNWRIPEPPILLSLALCGALALAAIRWPYRICRWVAITGLACLLALLIAFPFRALVHPRVLEITAIDVGQGDSIFVATPNGATMLVDAGGIPSFGRRENAPKSKMDIGEDVVAPYLWTRRIRRIDAVAISHLHDDHIGGLPAILNDFQVGELWVGVTPAGALWSAIEKQARQRGTRVRRLRCGEHLNLGGARIEVLGPPDDYVPGEKPGNNDSLVLEMTYGKRSVLLTGDMERPIEEEIANSARWPHADILKVGHHGSKTSSTSEFLDQVRPAFAVISDGYGNLYGHPHPVTLKALRDRRVLSFRTDRDGLITFLTDGQRIWRE
jgi:competence protein ComEC